MFNYFEISKHIWNDQPETEDYGVSWERHTSNNGTIRTLHTPKTEEEEKIRKEILLWTCGILIGTTPYFQKGEGAGVNKYKRNHVQEMHIMVLIICHYQYITWNKQVLESSR